MTVNAVFPLFCMKRINQGSIALCMHVEGGYMKTMQMTVLQTVKEKSVNVHDKIMHN